MSWCDVNVILSAGSQGCVTGFTYALLLIGRGYSSTTIAISAKLATVPRVLIKTMKLNPISSAKSRPAKRNAMETSSVWWVPVLAEIRYQSFLAVIKMSDLLTEGAEISAAARSASIPAITRPENSSSSARYGIKIGTRGIIVPSNVLR
jgi:hypothetical protein